MCRNVRKQVAHTQSRTRVGLMCMKALIRTCMHTTPPPPPCARQGRRTLTSLRATAKDSLLPSPRAPPSPRPTTHLASAWPAHLSRSRSSCSQQPTSPCPSSPTSAAAAAVAAARPCPGPGYAGTPQQQQPASGYMHAKQNPNPIQYRQANSTTVDNEAFQGLRSLNSIWNSQYDLM